MSKPNVRRVTPHRQPALGSRQSAGRAAFLTSSGLSVMRAFSSVLLLACLFCCGSVAANAASDCSSASFVTAASFPAGNQPMSIVARDFNGDGRLDLAVANYESDDVSVMLGNGPEGFSPPTNYTVGHHPTAIAAGDFNGDGQADLVTANDESGSVSVLLGSGSGAFSGATSIATDANPFGLAAGDFNGDGKDDVAVGSTNSNRVMILLGSGTGGLKPSASPLATGGRVYHVVLGKFNGDDVLDLVAGTEAGMVVFLGDGSGGFSPSGTPPGDYFSAVVAADFNGDGKTDLGGASVNNTGAIRLGDGAGNFAPPANTGGGAVYYLGMVAGDFNGDGKQDIAGVGDTRTQIVVTLGDGTGKLGASTSYSVGGDTSGIAAGDFDGDGLLDLAAASRQGSVFVLYGRGGGTFAGALSYGVGPSPDYTVVGDFNGDGHADLAVSNTSNNVSNAGASTISVLLGDGTGRMSAAPSIQFAGGLTVLRALVVADFNNDGKQDLAVAASGDLLDGVNVMLGKGDGTFSPYINTQLRTYGSYPTFIRAADFNRDGKVDLAVSFSGSANFIVLMGTGSGSFSDHNVGVGSGGGFGSGNLFTEFVAADFNGDGNPDLAFLLYYDQKLVLWLGNGTGFFPIRREVALGRSPLAVAVGDFDRDGKTDLAVTTAVDFTNYHVIILKGDGAGGFTATGDYEVGQYSQSITTGDFNGDGIADLAVANSQSDSVSILTGDGAGGFSPSIPFSVSSYPTSVVTADFDEDGKADLAVTQGQINRIAILRNGYTAPVPCMSINDVTMPEGDSGTTDQVFTVTLSRASAQRVKVNFRVDPRSTSLPNMALFITPTPGVDYQAVTGTLIFEPGDLSKTIIVPVNGDTLDEYDETFSVNLSNPRGAALHDAQGVGTIIDDDAAPMLSITGGQAAEGNSTFNPNVVSFQITLSAPSAKAVGVNYQTRVGTATVNDFQSASGTVTFLPGETSKTINISCTGDPTYEPDEDFFVDLTGVTNATPATATGRGVVLNDDPAPKVSISGSSITEGNAGTRNMGFTVNLTNASYQAVMVNYATADATATAGADYTAAAGTITFNPGEVSKTFTVPILGDTTDEIDETFFVNLSDATNASILNAQGTGTIFDDDGPTISVNDVSVKEGGPGNTVATFTVSLSAASPQTVSVRFGTAPGTATSFNDFSPVSNRTVFVQPGNLSATFTVVVIGDLLIEPDETFFVNLSNPVGGTILDGQGVCTIIDDEPPTAVQFGAAAYSTGEGAGSVSLTVTRSGDLSVASTVDYAADTDPGSFPCNATFDVASDRCDYTAVRGTLQFAAGETAKSFVVPIVDDSYVESSEHFTVALFNPTGAGVGSPSSATVTIADNDAAGQPNPVDTPSFFVRQQYLDFLVREPDAGGMQFYLNILSGCSGSDAECNKYTRGALSANFFRSPEFQQKGSFVMYLYMVSLGQRPATVAELSDATKIDRPSYPEFVLDLQAISDPTDDKAIVSAKKDALTVAWLKRSEVAARFPSTLSNQQFVQKLIDTSGVTPAAQADWVSALNVGTMTRAQVLRAFAESAEVNSRFYKQAFVTMEYFGYLRRDPEVCRGSSDPANCGYIFHNARFQLSADPDFLENTIVRGFIESPEYRARFGPK
ncbi:MAG: FG-GAP-like repeat-containing protein [Pyrinomonadaceae bacterium]